MTERVDRILDTAAALLVRHGYRRVTIEDVARESGIGKGTVYLHARTKDQLFLAVLVRAQRRVVDAVADRMDADPRAVLPGPMLRGIYDDLAADPVTRALYLADGEILGHLAHVVAGRLDGLRERRDTVLVEQLTLLREARCLRTDLTVDEQRYVLSAVGAGFFFVDPIADLPLDHTARSGLLEQVLAAALQEPDPPAAALAAVAPVVAAGYRSLLDLVDHEAHLEARRPGSSAERSTR